MIVKNEERVLPDCLRSARPYFGEIIVVDTGSTDRTREIAIEHEAQVVDFPWTESFSEARNVSLSHATGKWICWLDADDTLPPESGEAILNAVRNAPPQVVGFVIPVQFVEEDGSPTGTRVDHVKLFRNLPGVAFEGRIHEQVLPSLRATGGEIARCEAIVLHSNYDTSPEGQARKYARDDRLLALDLAERPGNPFILFNLGMTDYYRGRPKEALSWLTQSLAASQPTDSIVRKAYALLGLSQKQMGQIEECLKTLHKGLEVVPGDPELHFHLGHLLTERGEHRQAKEHYLQTLRADISCHFSSIDMGILGYKTFHNLGSLCLLMDDYPEACSWWIKAIEAAPKFLPSCFSLFEAALSRNDPATAGEMVERIKGQEGAGLNWAQMGAKLAEAQGGPPKAEAFLQAAVTDYPESTGPRLALARRLLQEGREEEADGLLHPLERAGVAEAAYFLGIRATRQDRLEEALAWMERAQELNPDHEETKGQIANLKRALADRGGRGK